MVAIGIAAAALVVIHWAHPTGQAVDQGMYYQDTTWYHMSFSARFAQTGHVGPLHFTDPLKLAAWFYPQNSELIHGLGIVFLKTDFLSPLMNLMWVALCLLAAWCVGRPYGIGGVTVLGAAVVLDSEMLVGSQAGQGPNDVAGLFFLMAALAFLVDGAASAHAAREVAAARRTEGYTATPTGARAGRGRGRPGGGGSTGSGDGRRWTALHGRPRRRARGSARRSLCWPRSPPSPSASRSSAAGGTGCGRSAIWLGGMVITCGFWYGRNFVEALNPFPQIHKIGPIHLPGPDQLALYPRQPHSLSEYYNDPRVWHAQALPGPPRPARTALAGDPRGRRRRRWSGRSSGGQRPDAGPRR